MVKNTGTTLKLLAAANHTRALLGGGPLNVDYEFVEMHFHWGEVTEGSTLTGSEHSIDGKKIPPGASHGPPEHPRRDNQGSPRA